MRRPIVAHITTIDLSLRYLLLNQLQSIRSAGYEVVGISAPGPDVPAIERAGIRHIAVPMTRHLTPWADLNALIQLYRLMRRERFTIVHTHTPKPGLLGQIAARLAGVPIVVNTLHGFYFHEHMRPATRRFYIAMEKIAASCSDKILSQNSEDIQTAIREGICPSDKIMHLGNGVDLTIFDPKRYSVVERRRHRTKAGIPKDAKVVGFVGRLAAKRKGFLDFLKAAEQLVKTIPNVYFLIVGDADYGKPDAVDPTVAKDYGIWDRCHFLGQRPNAELPHWYALMNVLVLPSLFEGVPRVVMEASAMGVPVVATDVKGNREAVAQGQSGLLVPLGDVQLLADTIAELLADRERAQQMGAIGRCLAMERFDEQQVFDRVKAEYIRLLHQKGLPPPEPQSLWARIS
ncbi:MAG TPA: glycosyltransferase family 4 protein [Roseiflexaceae bacterium]|nr:glycosyltransferase family 4 protein [Roseiflexaceae bacterium]